MTMNKYLLEHKPADWAVSLELISTKEAVEFYKKYGFEERPCEWDEPGMFFYQACEEARRLGADKLHISAHSSKENQAAYKALGCVHAKEINPKLAEKEPCDVQLEYVLD